VSKIADRYRRCCVQAGTTALAVLKYRKGVSEQFASGYEPDVLGVGPGGGPAPGGQPAYPPYPGDQRLPPGSEMGVGGDPYHQPPFSDPSRPAGGGGDFHPVTY